MHKTLVIIFGIVVLAVAAILTLARENVDPDIVFTQPPFFQQSSSTVDVPTFPDEGMDFAADRVADKAPVKPPLSALIKAPFIVQAPFANWNETFEETCEEAALLVVHSYLTGFPLTEENSGPLLLDMIEWEQKNLGHFVDTNIEELARVAREKYGHKTIVLQNVTQQDIEKWVAAGFPVIVPTAGRMLGNPYFSGDGPWYHMIPIVGYDDTSFITHDVGTKRGAFYRYDKELLMDAIHDWVGEKERIVEGPKTALILQ